MDTIMKNEKVLKVVAPAITGVVVLLIWEFLIWFTDTPVYLVPPPSAIAVQLMQDWGTLISSLMITVQITLTAFLCAVVIGVCIAFLFSQSRIIEVSLFPYAVILQVTPIVAIAPLVIIWMDSAFWAMVVSATLVALFPMISNTILGLRSVDPGLLSLFRLNGATRLQTLIRLRVPSAAPYFFGGLRISSGLALIGAVVAEFVAGVGGSQAGLAYQILQAGYNINVPRMFAALILITLTGVVLFTIMVGFSKLALGGWHESEINDEEA